MGRMPAVLLRRVDQGHETRGMLRIGLNLAPEEQERYEVLFMAKRKAERAREVAGCVVTAPDHRDGPKRRRGVSVDTGRAMGGGH